MPVNLVECEEQMQRRFPFKSQVDLASVRGDMLVSFKSDSALVGDLFPPFEQFQRELER
ncbi:MAG: hypothetical protein FWD31_02930 [Planctomycetaceae bacterium]|nr:hypothetical protein [Planctomycetaceae bacterium]